MLLETRASNSARRHAADGKRGEIAHSHGEARVRCIAHAFASILDNARRAPEGDVPFILDTAIAYLESLPGKLQRTRCHERKAP
jgi:hypothetical protein